MLKRAFEGNFFFSNILVPSVVLFVYLVSFEYLISPVLNIPNGVNTVFVSRSWRYFSFVLVGALIIFSIIIFRNGGKIAFTKSDEKTSSGDLILLLLPLTPVVQYIINNQDILSPLGSLSVLFFFALFSSIYIFVIPAALGFVGSTRTLIFLGLAFVFTITSMALLSSSFAWLDKGSLRIQLIFFGSTFLVTWLLYRLNDKKILHVLIVFIFVSNSIMQLSAQEDWIDRKSPPVEENKLVSLIEKVTPVVTPNIYLLVYDSYVTNETMLAHGIDNSPQEDYLEELSFKLYPNTYSVANYSIGSMSRVLNASREFFGDQRRGVSGDGIIQNILSNFGYETYGLFSNDYYFHENNPTYDFSIPEPSTTSPEILIRAILMGEFRFDIGFNELPMKQFIETKRNIFESISGAPVFIYMHSSLPGHSQNSGACLSDETDRFKKRLMSANLEMKQDIKKIIDNDPEAIIIVAGDHGPYLTKNCASLHVYDGSDIARLDIQDRFGTFLAIRWPTQDFEKFDDIVVLQDLFPAIFAYLFDDERFLESKIESSTFSPVVKVRNGIIIRGINRNEPLFLTDN